MKQLVLPIVLLVAVASAAQKKAVTETGEEVILYNDGTWKYANDSVKESLEIPINPKPLKKNAASTFLLKSTKFNIGVWIDPKKWSFKKAVSNESAEYEFELKNKDLYGMMITENLQIPMESFEPIAIQNAKEVAPDIKVVKREYRMVNDKKILTLQMNGTAQGIRFSFFGYYYSDANGTVQLVTYTAQNLFEKYLVDMEGFLDGLVTLD